MSSSSSTIHEEILQFYRQEVLNSIAKFQREGSSFSGGGGASSSSGSLPMMLSAFVKNNNRTTATIIQNNNNNVSTYENNYSNNNSYASDLYGQNNQNRNLIKNNNNVAVPMRRLCRCVVCGKEEHTSTQIQQMQADYEQTISSNPLSAHYFRLGAVSDEIANKFILYDGLDHCLSCAKRLACEILVPYFGSTRRDNSKRILQRISDCELNKNNTANFNNTASTESSNINNSTSSSSSSWTCESCGSKNTSQQQQNEKCEVCEKLRPQPLICPFCNQNAVDVEFCPKDPNTSFESHLTYINNDPVLNMSWRTQMNNNNSQTQNPFNRNNNNNNSNQQVQDIGGRHDAWRCDSSDCQTLNLGILSSEHRDFCRKCKRARLWQCRQCRNCYRQRERCPSCGSGLRWNGASSSSSSSSLSSSTSNNNNNNNNSRSNSNNPGGSEQEEYELARLSGMTVEEARRQRRANMVLDQAKTRSQARVEKQMGLFLVRAADDGNCLFRALSFQLFRTPELHFLLRLLAVQHIIEEKSSFIDFVFGLEEENDNENNNNNQYGENGSYSYAANLSDEEKNERRFLKYVTRLCKDGEWGDSLTLHAISKVFNCQIHIVSAALERWHTVISPSPSTSSNNNEDPSGAICSPIPQGRNNNNNTNSKEVPTFFDKVGLIFISFVAELHYNSFVFSKQDTKEVILPYREWILSGDARMLLLNSENNNNQNGNLPSGNSRNNAIDVDRNYNNNNNNNNDDDQEPEIQVIEQNKSSNSSNWRYSTNPSANNNNTNNNNEVADDTTSIPKRRAPPLPPPRLDSNPETYNNNNNNNNNQLQKNINSRSSSASSATTTTTPTMLQVRTQIISPAAPFDRVAIYVPNETGDPLWWINFHPQSGRLIIVSAGNRLNAGAPQFFQRHIVADVPDYISNSFPIKMKMPSSNGGNKFFFLLDEVGRNIVTTVMPFECFYSNTTNSYRMSGEIAAGNEALLASRDNVLLHSERSPRATVMASFVDGTCCLGPWLFVVEFNGRRATITLERPINSIGSRVSSIGMTGGGFRSPVRMVFVDEQMVHRCGSCGLFYVSGKHANCPALQQQQNNLQQGRNKYF